MYIHTLCTCKSCAKELCSVAVNMRKWFRLLKQQVQLSSIRQAIYHFLPVTVHQSGLYSNCPLSCVFLTCNYGCMVVAHYVQPHCGLWMLQHESRAVTG